TGEQQEQQFPASPTRERSRKSCGNGVRGVHGVRGGKVHPRANWHRSSVFGATNLPLRRAVGFGGRTGRGRAEEHTDVGQDVGQDPNTNLPRVPIICYTKCPTLSPTLLILTATA